MLHPKFHVSKQKLCISNNGINEFLQSNKNFSNFDTKSIHINNRNLIIISFLCAFDYME